MNIRFEEREFIMSKVFGEVAWLVIIIILNDT